MFHISTNNLVDAVREKNIVASRSLGVFSSTLFVWLSGIVVSSVVLLSSGGLLIRGRSEFVLQSERGLSLVFLLYLLRRAKELWEYFI